MRTPRNKAGTNRGALLCLAAALAGVTSLSACSSDSAPTHQESVSASSPGAAATPSSVNLPPSPGSESASPEISESEEPDSPIVFAASGRGNLKDLDKDLSDLQRAINEGGLFRVVGNVVEISFNMGQLEALTPPTDIADAWNAEMQTLRERVDAVTNGVEEESTLSQMRKRIAAAKVQIRILRGVFDQME